MSVIDPLVRDAYLARLGLEAEPPSADALARLHRAHIERVPWETLYIHLGERWDIDVAGSLARIAFEGRGGWCYHLNGALCELLRALGYDAVRHVGAVHGAAGPTADDMTNHLALTVHGLATETNPGGSWLVDVGLGDAMHDPLPLVPGIYPQPPYRVSLALLDGSPAATVADWQLAHDAAGSFAGMAWRLAPVAMDVFVDTFGYYSSSPQSEFVRFLMLYRRDATGVDVLRGLTLQRIGEGAAERVLASSGDLAGALRDVFHVDVGRIGPDRLGAVWAKARAAHDEWEMSRDERPPDAQGRVRHPAVAASERTGAAVT